MAYGMTHARRDPFARLDAWVIEELEALGRPKARPAERPKRRREPEVDALGDAANDEPLPMDENQFIQQVSAWLSGRPNADLILEEIWRNVVAAEADEALADTDAADAGLGDEGAGESDLDDPADAPRAEAQADAVGDPPEGPAESADDGADDAPQA